MYDETENIRRAQQAALNAVHGSREQLEAVYGTVWDTEELRADFDVRGFMAPYVVVVNRKTGKTGSLQFQDTPRFYFNFLDHPPKR